MLKTLGAQTKGIRAASALTPLFMILEVMMETIIPLMMASIIDDGVEAGDIHHMDGCSRRCQPFCRNNGRSVWCKGINWLCQKSEKSYV